MFSRSTALVVEPISLVRYAGQFFGARSYIVQGHTYRGYDTYDQAPLRTVLPSDDRHKWNANGASCSRAVAVYVATFTTSVLCKEGHVSYACIRNPRLVEIQFCRGQVSLSCRLFSRCPSPVCGVNNIRTRLRWRL